MKPKFTLLLGLPFCNGFSSSSPRLGRSTSITTLADGNKEYDLVGIKTSATSNATVSEVERGDLFSVTLEKGRPEPKTFLATWNRLWMDPRPVTVLIREALSGSSATPTMDEGNENAMLDADSTKPKQIPYCIVSNEFVIQNKHRFQISLFPRGRLAAEASSTINADDSKNGNAAAYLQYIPNHPGDEVDVGWQLELVDRAAPHPGNALAISTSGGLPLSNTTWSAAMTFCSEPEALESCGRAADWGSSGWSSESVCKVLVEGNLEARGSIVVYGSRSGETSTRFGGALGAALVSTADAGKAGKSCNKKTENQQSLHERSFKVGEVIVPMANHPQQDKLEDSFVTAGTDYRIMTMAYNGKPIFSTNDVPPKERKNVRLALRPCGWKLQQQLWNQQQQKQQQAKRKPMKTGSRPDALPLWPVEVPAGWLSTSARSRFNPSAFLPRLSATFRRDSKSVLLGVALALLPLPGALLGRNYVSLYAIPSASMDPTLIKGDVLLVEKFPGVDGRIKRGEITLFRPPSALEQIAGKAINNGRNGAPPLFVKRVVGLPGDKDIVLDKQTGEVTLNGDRAAVGPDRSLCADEPLRLIDRFLESGKGAVLEELGEDEFYVLGDCKAVSIDSRVFGVLPREKIEGRTLGRIWPLDRVTFRQL
ncbi:unnamed protein product [Pseudo-nitzschia multistriata]|uniref:Mitochondrial inner membrane protease subunit n=1 Tax=Pseudo-nitzschia multistriata TaxID=183589 RepID=A0A448YVK4_9STRA|nr:unnamed protein product [Pseudo-nitzschia multistriata]